MEVCLEHELDQDADQRDSDGGAEGAEEEGAGGRYGLVCLGDVGDFGEGGGVMLAVGGSAYRRWMGGWNGGIQVHLLIARRDAVTVTP